MHVRESDLQKISSLLTLILDEPELICLHTIKRYQALQFIICTQLNWFKHFYLTVIIQSNTNHLFTRNYIVSNIAIKQ